MLLALVNGAALLVALLLSAYRLSDLRQTFGDYASGQATLYQLAEIKAGTLAVSRADLLAPETPQQLADADALVRARWARLREGLPAEQREAADKAVLANWNEFRKNFDNAIKIFASAPQDALSIPERIYAMYLVPLNQALDHYSAAHQTQAAASQAGIQRRIDNLLWVVLTPLLIAGIVVLAFQIRFGQRIRKRVAAMSAVAGHLAAGDLQHRLPAGERDELGELAAHFNGFIEAFEHILRDVQRAVADVGRVTRSVAQQSESLGRHTQDQSHQLEATTRAIGEISRAVEDIAHAAAEASQSAAQASDMGVQSGHIGAATLARLDELGGAVGLAADQLSRLSHSITQIGDVSALIKDIASQTNLLALNAAIEAARAGEHGRGFAVVADEVRALSERTAASTGRIEELLQQVWMASAEVVASIRRAEEKAALSRDQGGVMNENIGNMVPAVGEVSHMLDGIAAATEQHASATASIHGLVEQAAGIARERVRQLDRTREDMAALTEVAQGLQQATGRFRVSSLGQPG